MPFRGLFAGVLVASVLGGVILIGDGNVRKGAQLRTSTTNDPMMKGLSLDNWRAMPRVALVLYIDNAHLAHGTDGEMAEAVFHHFQHAVDPDIPSALDEEPREKKKKKVKNTPNKKVSIDTATEPVATTDIL